MKPLWKDGKVRCFTLSYDDGITQDLRLIEIFDRYGLKCTFNLNSGLFGLQNSRSDFPRPVQNDRLCADVIRETYRNHEIAVHTLTHPNLADLQDEAEILRQVDEDQKNLSALAGYPVVGMAYPGGGVNYTPEVAALLRRQGPLGFRCRRSC